MDTLALLKSGPQDTNVMAPWDMPTSGGVAPVITRPVPPPVVAPSTGNLALDRLARAQRTTAVVPPRMFVADRPRADRFVYVLLNQLAQAGDPKAADAHAWYDRNRETMTVDQGSDWINRIKARIQAATDDAMHDAVVDAMTPARPPVENAVKPRPAYDTYDDVPDAYYALTVDGTTKFYRVKRREGRGQYEGRTFLNVYAQASDELHTITAWNTRKTILDGIREIGAHVASALYGQHIGRCGRCHRTLTDETSRANGLGPECINK